MSNANEWEYEHLKRDPKYNTANSRGETEYLKICVDLNITMICINEMVLKLEELCTVKFLVIEDRKISDAFYSHKECESCKSVIQFQVIKKS